MQQELIEMLEEMVKYFDEISSDSYYYRETASILNEAEKLVEKVKNSAKEPSVPQGEPDFWGSGDGCWVRATDKLVRPDASRFNIPLYAAPSQPVTLTDEEICECFGIDGADDWVFKGARAIIEALRAKDN